MLPEHWPKYTLTERNHAEVISRMKHHTNIIADMYIYIRILIWISFNKCINWQHQYRVETNINDWQNTISLTFHKNIQQTEARNTWILAASCDSCRLSKYLWCCCCHVLILNVFWSKQGFDQISCWYVCVSCERNVLINQIFVFSQGFPATFVFRSMWENLDMLIYLEFCHWSWCRSSLSILIWISSYSHRMRFFGGDWNRISSSSSYHNMRILPYRGSGVLSWANIPQRILKFS